MLNVTRVTLSHNRIACKLMFGESSEIDKNLWLNPNVWLILLQQFHLVSQIWRIWRFWIWPTITSKSCQFRFHRCQNFAFSIFRSIASAHCRVVLVPSLCSKFLICRITIWTKVHCPATFSWWVIQFHFNSSLCYFTLKLRFYLQKLFVLCTWETTNLSIFHLVLETWRICKL